MSRTIRVDGRDLSLEDVADVARSRAAVEPRLDPETRDRVQASRDRVQEMLERDAPVYGVNTGFGRLSDVRVPREQLGELQLNLVRSHACGVGEPLSDAETRAMILVRANSLAVGYSGVRPAVIESMLGLLARDVLPVIPREGSVGASGDLAPAAHLALVLVGEGEAAVEGRRVPGAEALARAGLEPVSLEPKEGLALLNGTQAMTAVGALALLRAEGLSEAAELAGAMSLEGLKGSPEPFRADVQEVRPHPGQGRTARRLRGLLDGSEIRESHREDDPRVQDAYSLRCMPQVHGASGDAMEFARAVLSRELNSATDNPLVFPDDAAADGIVSQGNFHGQPVAAALDALSVAVCNLAVISERRLDRLLNPDLSGLPAFLSPEPGLGSGFMMLQVTAANQVATCRRYAQPASVGSIPTGAGKEDHVSMGMQAADEAAGAVRCLERVLAAELICAAQAVEFHRPLRSGSGVEEGLGVLREAVPPLQQDRVLWRELDRVVGLLRSGRLGEIVRRAAVDASPSG